MVTTLKAHIAARLARAGITAHDPGMIELAAWNSAARERAAEDIAAHWQRAIRSIPRTV